MKSTFFKSALFAAALAGVFSACVNDDEYETPNFDCTETSLVKTIEVAAIPFPAEDPIDDQSIVTQYTEDEVIEAYVTSSDEGGNFFKTISFQTLPSEGPVLGFSVPIDVTSTFINYEPGRKVLIKVKDLYTDVSNGGKRIGSIFINSSGTAAVGRMPESQYRDALNKSCTIVPETDLIRTMTIAEAKNNNVINTLIEIEDVQFTDAAITTTYYDADNDLGGATNHNLVDAAGGTLIFRTSSFANYASKPVAPGRGKVRGVMTKFGDDFQFVARTERDIMLDGPRLSPLFSENFESITSTGNNQYIALPGWSNVSMNAGTEKWEARIFSNNKYAQFSPFGLTPAENDVDTRLITPGINLDNSSDEFLRFGSKIGFANGEAVTLWISTDYNGGNTVADVNAATWTQLDPVWAAQTSSYPADFTSSGNVDLSAYSGTVYLSFRYVGGTNGITSTYQIDNIEIYGNSN